VRITDSHGVFIAKELVEGIRSAISDSHSDKTFEKRSISKFGVILTELSRSTLGFLLAGG